MPTQTPKNIPPIALINASREEMDSAAFKEFISNLLRTGHELVVPYKMDSRFSQILGITVTPFGDLITRKGSQEAALSAVTLVVLGYRMEDFLMFQALDGGTGSIDPKELIWNLGKNDDPGKHKPAVITDPADYGWLISKLANVHGVRRKDKAWLFLKAAIVFGLGSGAIMKLVQKTRPKTPKLEPAFPKANV